MKYLKRMSIKKVGIFLFENVELLDFAGPYEVFSVTNELNEFKLFRTFTISEDGEAVKTVNGLRVFADYSVNNCPLIDILIIPGGAGARRVLNNIKMLKWVKESFENSEITFSVCSGAMILGKTGILDNKEYTTHHEVLDDMKKIAPKAILTKEKRFVDNGKLLTSGGISAGIDLSLYLVEKLHGKTVKEKTVVYMEYNDWRKVMR